MFSVDLDSEILTPNSGTRRLLQDPAVQKVKASHRPAQFIFMPWSLVEAQVTVPDDVREVYNGLVSQSSAPTASTPEVSTPEGS